MLNFVNKNKLLTYVKFYFYYIINCRDREFMIFNETKTHEITVDVVIMTMKYDALHVLLVKRTTEPFKDKWAIPGGYVRLSENLDQAALRILKERTNIDNVYLEQLYTFGDPLRHPNARVITCAYFALVRAEDFNIVTTPELGWHKISNLPALAFDHKDIIEYSLKRTRERLELCPVAYQLLNEKFTLTEMQKAYELIMFYIHLLIHRIFSLFSGL